ncbi:hypothetical protein R75461_07760 [Paraburkholderia nemoris]|uniref:hypothetical protein n=1 Tax=Paraburkholderia nemoris TaxID=2793076 RepID=UPI00190E35C7|nr:MULTISPECIES: hypothetical protein [Paraburkholderia]MBK3786541.1 hypothetical protein [Paraburkholderia aspalathi]CAE6856892.1 hypothetical protein R75461_07760 [Paraburkholderia nemoris]
MWPVTAVPETWIVSLFARMQATFGARFTALWADADLDLVKLMWAEALAGVPPDELKRAVALLPREKRPPDLPRFLELCEPVPAAQRVATGAMCLPLERADPAIVDASLAGMRELVAPLACREPSPRWAFGVLQRGTAKNGRPLTHEARRVGTDAVVSPAGRAFYANTTPALRARYRTVFETALRKRGEPLPSREPGEDDEQQDERQQVTT